jgi:hypothetical protein
MGYSTVSRFTSAETIILNTAADPIHSVLGELCHANNPHFAVDPYQVITPVLVVHWDFEHTGPKYARGKGGPHDAIKAITGKIVGDALESTVRDTVRKADMPVNLHAASPPPLVLHRISVRWAFQFSTLSERLGHRRAGEVHFRYHLAAADKPIDACKLRNIWMKYQRFSPRIRVPLRTNFRLPH